MAWDVAYPSQRFNLSFGTKQVLGGDIVAMSNTVLAMFVRFVLLANPTWRIIGLGKYVSKYLGMS